MESFEGLAEFHHVATHRSISGAAKALGIPRATVARRLAALEERLGTRLAHRTTRTLALTAAGEALFERTHSLLADLEAATTAVQRLDGVPRGLLRVSAPPLQEEMGMGRFIVQFLQRYPEVEVELITGTRYVDLREERVDVALRAGRVRDTSLIARKLVDSSLMAVASPAYLQEHGTPASLADLAKHQCLAGFDKGTTPQTHWPTFDGPPIQISSRLRSNSIEMITEATRAGMGIAMLPDVIVRGDVADGTLVHVLPDMLGISGTLSLVYIERRLQDPKVRCFIDDLAKWFADEVGPALTVRRPPRR